MRGILRKFREDKGAATLIEAVIVFPIVFFVVLAVIFLGNMYFVRSKMDAIADKNAVLAVQYIKNPTLYYIDKDSSYELSGHKISPYQQIFGADSEVISALQTKVKTEATGKNTLLGFMKPINVAGKDGGSDTFLTVDRGFFGTSVEVEINYKIRFFPVNFPMFDAINLKQKAYAKAEVNDSVEFIRNIDFAIDLHEDLCYEFPAIRDAENTIKDKISDAFDMIKNTLNFFKGK